MADPQRLVDDPDAAPLGRALLSSASDDAPGADRRSAVAKRLAVAGLLVAGGSQVGPGAAASAFAWWKLGLIVVALDGAITGAVVMTREPAREPEPVAITTTATPTTTAAPRAPTAPPGAPAALAPPVALPTAPAVTPRPPAPTRVAPRPTPPVAAKPPSPPPLAAAPPPAAPPPAAPPPADPAPAPISAIDARRLAAEVAILDRARAALRRGDTNAALAALDRHSGEFSDGALVAEAELVRIETLIRRGETVTARARAGEFLVRFPQSPLAKRVRSLVDSLPSAKESP